MPLTFGSLFAGIGGLDLGFERAGMLCKWQVEIDDFATRVLERHWPSVKRWRDVTTFPPGPEFERVDLICGGFPCQDVSYAGKRAGIDGKRTGLWQHFIRVASEMGPRIIVMENVSGLLTAGMGSILGTLASLGYDAEWDCIPAAAVGAPHRRDRVFIVAYTTKGVGRGQGWSRRIVSENQRKQNSSDVGDTECNNLEGRERRLAEGIVFGKSNPPQRRQWVDLPEPIFCRSADGIPDRVDRLKSLGNAVVPQVAEYIAERIINADIW